MSGLYHWGGWGRVKVAVRSEKQNLLYLGYLDFEHQLPVLMVGQMGQASENLVHWTSYVSFVPLGKVGEGPSSCKIRKAKFTIPDTEILNIVWLG